MKGSDTLVSLGLLKFCKKWGFQMFFEIVAY